MSSSLDGCVCHDLSALGRVAYALFCFEQVTPKWSIIVIVHTNDEDFAYIHQGKVVGFFGFYIYSTRAAKAIRQFVLSFRIVLYVYMCVCVSWVLYTYFVWYFEC